MPSENKTPHYGLNQWQGHEYPKREDFNHDNDLIDTALAAHTGDTTVHITAAERTAWNGKAEKTDVAPDAKMVQTQSHPDYHLRVVYDEMGSFYLDAANSIGETVYVKVSDTRNTASVAGAMTVSTAEPTSFIGAGKFWGVY